MKRNSRLFFSEQDIQTNDTLQLDNQIPELEDNNFESVHCSFSDLLEPTELLRSSIENDEDLESSQNPILITQRLNQDLARLSTEKQKLNYIGNFCHKKINIMSEAITARINSSPHPGIKKIEDVTIIELLILARSFPTLISFAKKIQISRTTIASKLFSIGLDWYDLVNRRPELIESLSSLGSSAQATAFSCLNQSVVFYAECRGQSFNFEERLDEIIIEFANRYQSIKDIARKFFVRDKFLSRNLYKIIALLRKKFIFSQNLQHQLMHDMSFNNVRYICGLIYEQSFKTDNPSAVIEGPHESNDFNQSIAYVSGNHRFSYKENLDQVILEFANLKQSVKDIEKKLSVRKRYFAENYDNIIELLKKKYVFPLELVQKISPLFPLDKLRHLCIFISEQNAMQDRQRNVYFPDLLQDVQLQEMHRNSYQPLDNSLNVTAHWFMPLSSNFEDNVQSQVMNIIDNPLLIAQKFNDDLRGLSTDIEKLNYIKNFCYKKTKIIVGTIINKINSSPFYGLKKINDITIIEFLILARKFPTISSFTNKVGISPNTFSSKLSQLGMGWVDLRHLNPSPIISLSNRLNTGITEESCLDKTIEFCTKFKFEAFNLEKKLDELIVEFANTQKTVKDIAQKFMVRNTYFADAYEKIIKLLKKQFVIPSYLEEQVSTLSPLKKLRCYCGLICAQNLKRKHCAITDNAVDIIEHENIQSEYRSDYQEQEYLLEEDDELLEALLYFNEDNQAQLFDNLIGETDADSKVNSKDDEDLLEALSYFIEDNDEQLLNKESEAISADSKTNQQEDFEKALAYFAENYQEYSYDINIAITINEGCMERLSSLFISDDEPLAKQTYTLPGESGLFADNTITSSSREVTSEVSSQTRATRDNQVATSVNLNEQNLEFCFF